jgi:hypothetical protein
MLQSSRATFGMGKEKGLKWTEVTILQEPEKAGGNFQVKCGHCELVFWRVPQESEATSWVRWLVESRNAPNAPKPSKKQLQDIDQAKRKQEM